MCYYNHRMSTELLCSFGPVLEAENKCMIHVNILWYYYALPMREQEAMMLSDVCVSDICLCLTSDVSLSRTSGLSREQRGLGRLELAQRYSPRRPTSHVTRTPLSRSKGQRSKVKFTGAGAYYGGLPPTTCCFTLDDCTGA